ncbi:hypothetical protein H310_03328 [Aphanomyces invadans]|uniref:Sugar phosphate transporter domain-containing protein n=1 Tax=Aphanomyces invadans TaxID=157072 RepID=A0A024UH10_9STRA|nr:hypothetical protein H310_03328 [Aphanomyces invadans]ETW05584.1 hypothetical protein H310_03328 [Aphanomyces invadans]|eukprot:XP_008865361.1 hypothetical protein H310_03328 [Aphanomyces invadans]
MSRRASVTEWMHQALNDTGLSTVVEPLATASLLASSKHGAMTTSLMYLCLGLFLVASTLILLKFWLQTRSTLVPATKVRLIHLLDVAICILGWYAMSISMTLFNKWFVKVWHGGFPFVFTMGAIHMSIKSVLTRIMMWRHPTSIAVVSPRNYWRLCFPIGLFTGADIVMSSMSLRYITVSFFTIVKSGGNVWNLVFSIFLGLQRLSPSLLFVVIVISAGIGLASYGVVHFVMIGFVLVLSASILGTLRWVLTQFFMHQLNTRCDKSLTVVYHIAPVSALSLLPIALCVDGPALSSSLFVQDAWLLLECSLFLIAGGVLSFVLIYVEVELVKKTSALSLGIAGNLKDVMQILMAMLVFQDHLSAVNGAGLMVATIGLMWYSYLKATTAAPAAPPEGYATVLQHDQLDDDISDHHPATEGLHDRKQAHNIT